MSVLPGSDVLRLRTPHLPWLVTAAAAALSVQGAVWLGANLVMGGGRLLPQLIMALGWSVCALVLWLMSAPKSRLHAVFSACLCALALSLIGTLTAWVRLKGEAQVPQAFSLLGGVLILAHLVMALPAIIALQATALTRRP